MSSAVIDALRNEKRTALIFLFPILPYAYLYIEVRTPKSFFLSLLITIICAVLFTLQSNHDLYGLNPRLILILGMLSWIWFMSLTISTVLMYENPPSDNDIRYFAIFYANIVVLTVSATLQVFQKFRQIAELRP